MISRSLAPIGFYHVAVAPLTMGFSMLIVPAVVFDWKTRGRLGIMCILVLGIILALCDSFLNISPLAWLVFPVLCCSVLIGVGMQGMVSAGWADRKWLLTLAIIMATLAIVTLLLATKYFQVFAGVGKPVAQLFTKTAIMYLLGAIAAGIIFFMARAKLRIRWARWLVLSSAMAVDIFLGARFIADTIL
jgi:hypothetical protein